MNKNVTIFIGILALIVIIYRIIFMAMPMFISGVTTKNPTLVFKSLTLLV
jgi:hypothetical protein